MPNPYIAEKEKGPTIETAVLLTVPGSTTGTHSVVTEYLFFK